MIQLKISPTITDRGAASLDKYLQDMGREELISVQREIELAQRIRRGDQKARDELTKANLRFVVSVSKQYQGRGLPLGDLISEGNLGLIKAAEKFDETKGFKFISYAVWWIRQSILQALSEQSNVIRLPLNKVSHRTKINRACQRFLAEKARFPDDWELAELVGLEEKDIRDYKLSNQRVLSIDKQFDNEDSDSGTLLSILSDPESLSPEKRLVQNNSFDIEFERILDALFKDWRVKEIICGSYGILGYPRQRLEEIAWDINITKEGARQIKEKALNKLRTSFIVQQKLKQYLS